jgi:hypothetical protein
MRHASVLFEVLVAVAILVGSGTAIMAAADRGERLLRRGRDLAQASDLARSVMAAIEAGLVTPQNAPASVRCGPVGAAWLTLDPDNRLPESVAGEARWTVEVESEPTEWNGLAFVRVLVRDRRAGEGAPPACTMVQIVRLTPEGSDMAGQKVETGKQSRPSPRGAGKGGGR